MYNKNYAVFQTNIFIPPVLELMFIIQPCLHFASFQCQATTFSTFVSPLLLTVVYAFLLPVLGLQHMASCSMPLGRLE
jgi:hypothetical protein